MNLSKRTYWSTLLVGAALAELQTIAPVKGWLGKPATQWLTASGYVILAVSVVALIVAYFIASPDAEGGGGKGGTGTASGESSSAFGGDGGKGGRSKGGDGGDASAIGRGSIARGGKGGNG